MVPTENKNNAYAKFWRENKEYYGSFENGLFVGSLLYSERFFPGYFGFSLPSKTNI